MSDLSSFPGYIEAEIGINVDRESGVVSITFPNGEIGFTTAPLFEEITEWVEKDCPECKAESSLDLILHEPPPTELEVYVACNSCESSFRVVNGELKRALDLDDLLT